MVTKLSLHESLLITISQLNMSDSIKISISYTCFFYCSTVKMLRKNAHSSEVDLGVQYGIHEFFFEIIFFEHHCFQLFWISKQISRHQVLR